jgi:hypothetical protein
VTTHLTAISRFSKTTATLLLLGSCFIGCRIERVSLTDTAPLDAIAARLGPRACGIAGGAMLTGEGIGHLVIGRTVDSMGKRCRIIADSVVAGGDEPAQRVVLVDLVRDTATIVAVRDTIVRIELHHSPFRTADSLGVGGHLGRILRLRDPVGETIDGRLYGTSPSHCGLLFQIQDQAPAPPAVQNGAGALRRLPGETRITRVVIVGCKGRS